MIYLLVSLPKIPPPHVLRDNNSYYEYVSFIVTSSKAWFIVTSHVYEVGDLNYDVGIAVTVSQVKCVLFSPVIVVE